MTQTTVTLTGGVKVNLNLNPDRKSHDKARDALEAIQEHHDVPQREAVALALVAESETVFGYEMTPAEALESLQAFWQKNSDAATVREALRRYGSEVEA